MRKHCALRALKGVCIRGSVYVPDGYWRFSIDSAEIFKCPFALLGNASDILGSSVNSLESLNHTERCASLTQEIYAINASMDTPKE